MRGNEQQPLLGERLPAPSAARRRSEASAERLLASVAPGDRAPGGLPEARRSSTSHVLDVYLCGARRMELIGQRMLDGLEAAQALQSGGRRPAHRRAGKADRDRADHHAEPRRSRSHRTPFRRALRSESKPYALDWTHGPVREGCGRLRCAPRPGPRRARTGRSGTGDATARRPSGWHCRGEEGGGIGGRTSAQHGAAPGRTERVCVTGFLPSKSAVVGAGHSQ